MKHKSEQSFQSEGSFQSIVIEICSNFLRRESKSWNLFSPPSEGQMTKLVGSLRNDMRKSGEEQFITRIDATILELSKLKLNKSGKQLVEKLRNLNDFEKVMKEERIIIKILTEEIPDYYAVLGVSKNATDREISIIYRSAAKECAPDKDKGEKIDSHEIRIRAINEAHENLKTVNARYAYEEKLKEKRDLIKRLQDLGVSIDLLLNGNGISLSSLLEDKGISIFSLREKNESSTVNDNPSLQFEASSAQKFSLGYADVD